MVRLRYAALFALLLTAGWLLWLGYVANWRQAVFCESLGEAALSWRLLGLGATCYSVAAASHRDELRHCLAIGDQAGESLARREVVRVRMTVARILLAARRPDAAVHFAEEAHRADPSDVGAAALMWRVRHAGGMTAQARRELMLLGLRDASSELLTALAALFLAEERFEQARDFASRARERDSRNAEAWLVLAQVLDHEGHSEDARQAIHKAIECAAAQPDVRLEASRLYLQLHPDKSQWMMAGRGLDYWGHLVVTRVAEYWAFALGLGGYVLLLFSPALAGALGMRRFRVSTQVSCTCSATDTGGNS